MKTDLKNSSKEHQYLLDRLKRLEKHQKKIHPRAKVRVNPWQKNLFDRKSKNVKSVTHRIDYEPHREKQFEKTSNLIQRQADIELDPCTFNPHLNQRSLKMAEAKDHIMERDVPDRYKRSLIEEKKRIVDLERLEDEEAQMRLPDYSGRVPDEGFFNKTVQWKQNATERSQQVKQKNYEGETVGMKHKPSICKKSEELASQRNNGQKFLERVPKVIEDKKLLRQKLDTKYYNFPHKPQLHRPEKRQRAE